MINYKQAAKAKQTVELESFLNCTLCLTMSTFCTWGSLIKCYKMLVSCGLLLHLLCSSHILLLQFFTGLHDYSLSNRSFFTRWSYLSSFWCILTTIPAASGICLFVRLCLISAPAIFLCECNPIVCTPVLLFP